MHVIIFCVCRIRSSLLILPRSHTQYTRCIWFVTRLMVRENVARDKSEHATRAYIGCMYRWSNAALCVHQWMRSLWNGEIGKWERAGTMKTTHSVVQHTVHTVTLIRFGGRYTHYVLCVYVFFYFGVFCFVCQTPNDDGLSVCCCHLPAHTVQQCVTRTFLTVKKHVASVKLCVTLFFMM